MILFKDSYFDKIATEWTYSVVLYSEKNYQSKFVAT